MRPRGSAEANFFAEWGFLADLNPFHFLPGLAEDVGWRFLVAMVFTEHLSARAARSTPERVAQLD